MEIGRVEIASSPPPAKCIFIFPSPYAFESQESMGASCRLCRCLFDAFTADILKWIPIESGKPSVLGLQEPILEGG